SDLSPGTLQRTVTSHALRIGKVIRTVFLLLGHSGRRYRLYLSAESSWGLIYTLVLLTAARVSAADRIFVHYHSFTFVDMHSRLMEWIVNIGGRKTTHIFLCERMREGFYRHYPSATHSLIVSNAYLVRPATNQVSLPLNRAAGLRVGLLSQLFPDK